MSAKRIKIEHKELGEAVVLESAFRVWEERGWKKAKDGDLGYAETPTVLAQSGAEVGHDTDGGDAPTQGTKAPAKKTPAKKTS